jgi:inner membrane protein
MLLFAHLGLTLAAAGRFRRMNPSMTLVALGSMLPDIIDKPLGCFIFGSASNGRIYAHTLLFLMVLMVLAFFNPKVTWLAGGVLAHLFLDQMWSSPVILLWPLLGSFPLHDPLSLSGYLELLLIGLKNPGVYIPEILGLAYLLYLVYSDKQEILSRSRTLFKGQLENLDFVDKLRKDY